MSRTVTPTEIRILDATKSCCERWGIAKVTIDDIAAEVGERTAHLGEPPRKRFTGHLTLARLKPFAQMPRMLGSALSAEFVADEIALVQSRLDPAGARYETIDTWPLGLSY